MATMIWDAADNIIRPAHDQKQASLRRNKNQHATKKCQSELLTLLACSTLYSLAAGMGGILQKYVYLLRSLAQQGRDPIIRPCIPATEVHARATSAISVPAVSNSCWDHLATPAKLQQHKAGAATAQQPSRPNVEYVELIYQQTHFAWTDGLDELRAIFCNADSEADEERARQAPMLVTDIQISTLEDIQWYLICAGKDPASFDMRSAGPPDRFPLTDLLAWLGVGAGSMAAVAAKIRPAHLSALKAAAMPAFLEEIICTLDSQMPELALAAKHESHGQKLLQGAADAGRMHESECQSQLGSNQLGLHILWCTSTKKL